MKSNENKYTVIVLKNYDKKENPNEVVFVAEDQEVILATTGIIDDEGLLQSKSIGIGGYIDLTRAYLGLGRTISRDFETAVMCHKTSNIDYEAAIKAMKKNDALKNG